MDCLQWRIINNRDNKTVSIIIMHIFFFITIFFSWLLLYILHCPSSRCVYVMNWFTMFRCSLLFYSHFICTRRYTTIYTSKGHEMKIKILWHLAYRSGCWYAHHRVSLIHAYSFYAYYSAVQNLISLSWTFLPCMC